MENETTTEAESSETMQTAEVKEPAELRAALDRANAKAAQYRDELMDSRLDAIGLKATEGLGKAIAKEYDGDMTVEALSAYAQAEYNHQGQVAEVPAEVATTERLEQLSGVSEAVTPPPEEDPAGELTAKMADPETGREDAELSIAAKSNQFYQEQYG